MSDTLSPEQRSERMSRVKSKDTKPEFRVRRIAYAMGFRYRLNRKDLPGKPDLVFVKLNKVIFVHGCFWHRHRSCRLARLPKSRLDFWLPKLEENRKRDLRTKKKLSNLGWKSLVIWECELGNRTKIERRIKKFLELRHALN